MEKGVQEESATVEGKQQDGEELLLLDLFQWVGSGEQLTPAELGERKPFNDFPPWVLQDDLVG